MKAKELEAMKGVRAQAMLVRRLRERLGEQEGALLQSRRMDAMPAGGARGGGLDVRLVRLEEMKRILAREAGVLSRLERRARAAMEGLRPEVYAFCAVYYIGALGMEETADAIERSLRQCKRYKREIEGGEEDAAE